MILTSPSFEQGGFIPKKFSREGGNINPELLIQNVPEGAKSLVFIVRDPDVPKTFIPSGIFDHWVVWNIDPRTTVVRQESVPPGSVEGANTSGMVGYTGPHPPPPQTHHYEFRLYALDAMLDLPPSAGAPELEEEIQKHLLAETMLVGLYTRQAD
jgi:Raf kinase inhibitor-like YbhB/YbcL family protein